MRSRLHSNPGALLDLFASIHLLLHAALPGAVALLAFRPRWPRAWLIMLATMAVDLDHLLAEPVFDPARCSIGFHPLHTWPLFPIYLALAVFPRTRLVGIGLIIHMLLDGADCLL